MATELRLSPKQEQSIGQSLARINVWEGSVRSGKTIASLLRWLMYVARAPRGGELVVCAKTLDTVARNVFAPLQDPAVTGPAARLVKYTRGAPTATILGRTVEVITANNELAEGRIRGLTCAGAYVDEATLIPESFWTQLLARLSVPGAQLFATTNPDNPNHWLRKRFLLRTGELDLRSWHFTIDDNHSLDPKYVASLKAEYVGLWYRRFILGKWVAAEGAVYDMFDPDEHVVPFERVPIVRKWLGVGVDYGTRNPFDALLGGIGVDGRIYFVSEWRHDSRQAQKQLSDVELSAGLRTWLTTVRYPRSQLRGITPEVVCVDPSAASFKVQLFRDGLPAMNANNDVLDGIRTWSSLMAADKFRVVDSCKWLVDELPGYSWDDKAANRGEDAVIKVDDHSVDAGRYLLHTTRSRWRGEVLPALSEQAAA
ncbi:MAG TPA: PBSX family phage terminase large subunit [Pseudonocardiaceae bacterium]|jgi:PBSX family phage terminase large subunit|nr:PBSX family phage terminase large subunit [Pseudonocardiaceae bacterium]